jgi:hypothetical protein
MTNGNECVYPFAEQKQSQSKDILGNPMTNFRTVMTGGLTKHELFAAMAMQAFCAHPVAGEHAEPIDIALMAIEQADALIEALNK